MSILDNEDKDSTSELIPITPEEKLAFKSIWEDCGCYEFIDYTKDNLPIQDAFYTLATKLGIDIT